MTKEELNSYDLKRLRTIHHELDKELAAIRKQLARNVMASSLAARRARRLAADTLLGCRLDRRIEHLFSALKEGKPRVPAEQVVHIIDGVVARTISRRIWIGLVTLIAVTPAIISLVLLGIQNKTMMQKLDVEIAHTAKKDREELITMFQANRIRWIGSGDTRQLENFSSYHPRIRASAMATYIAMEKKDWKPAERTALPATRMIDLRNGEFIRIELGSQLSLMKEAPTTDLTRVRFDGSNFTTSRIYNLWLDGSSFRNCVANGAVISCPSAKHSDFSGMSAQGALISWAPDISEPFNIENSNFDDVDLTGGIIQQVIFKRCSMKGTNLTNVIFDMATFAHCDLTQVKLGKADFSKNLNVFVKCLVTKKQSDEITLPSYCDYEKTDDPNILKITLDYGKYEAYRDSYFNQ
ncbi:MAG: pentapeptide repeat-containing protein [Akkermansiaceae bacterium]